MQNIVYLKNNIFSIYNIFTLKKINNIFLYDLNRY